MYYTSYITGKKGFTLNPLCNFISLTHRHTILFFLFGSCAPKQRSGKSPVMLLMKTSPELPALSSPDSPHAISEWRGLTKRLVTPTGNGSVLGKKGNRGVERGTWRCRRALEEKRQGWVSEYHIVKAVYRWIFFFFLNSKNINNAFYVHVHSIIFPPPKCVCRVRFCFVENIKIGKPFGTGCCNEIHVSIAQPRSSLFMILSGGLKIKKWCRVAGMTARNIW